MRHFSPLDLKQHLKSVADTPLLLDARSLSERVPMGQIKDAMNELDPERETIVICHHGIRSRQVAYYLEHQGFSRVINLEGGVERWAQLIDPAMQRY